jgi:hypothetical protein
MSILTCATALIYSLNNIMGNKPVADHRGDIYFHADKSPMPSTGPATTPMTEITYNIRCKAPWYLPSFIIGFFIKKDMTQALKKLAIHFKTGAV